MQFELQNNCPLCVEEWKNNYKRCVICHIEYNESGDMRADSEEEMKKILNFEEKQEMEKHMR